MSRIAKAYETRFRWLLQQARARQLDRGVQWLMQKAQRLSASEHLSSADALARVHNHLAGTPGFKRLRARQTAAPTRFFCDAGLGGLARWLRAAGHEALWEAGIDDDEMLRAAREQSATILTTDSMLMERRILRDRVIPSYWLPPTLGIPEQLALVFREFRLTVRERRCMSCGGELERVEKEAVRERIPPRTYRWLDGYFVCRRCGKLFWEGTHWFKIARVLEALKG